MIEACYTVHYNHFLFTVCADNNFGLNVGYNGPAMITNIQYSIVQGHIRKIL